MTQLLLVDEPAPHIRQLTLNRPEQLNAMTSELCEELHYELREIAIDRACRAVILTGAGRGFCAGLDLHGYGAAPENDGSDESRDRLANQQHMSTLILELRALPQPVIAAVNGPAAGFGLALALGCDIRYASSDAVFRAAFINIGVSNCDMGTSWLLPRLIGASRAHELMLTGRRVDAEEALRIGLINEVVPHAELMARAETIARHIVKMPPVALRMMKEFVVRFGDLPTDQAWHIQNIINNLLIQVTTDGEEGRRAFNAKRPPNFTGALRRRGEAWEEPSDEDRDRLDEAYKSGEF